MNQQHIGYLIKSINDRLKTKADDDLKKHKLTLSQSRIVAFLKEKNGTATQKEIEDFLMVSHPTIVGLVSRMEQNGIVKTHFDANNRSKLVKLTEYAEELAKDMGETILANEQKLLAGLSDDEVIALKKTLNVVLNNLEK